LVAVQGFEPRTDQPSLTAPDRDPSEKPEKPGGDE
jgi:hypothetical protein